MPLSSWLRNSLSILYVASQCAVGNKMAAASMPFGRVFEEDLNKVLNDL